MNFVRGGNCYATGAKCLLGAKGASVKNNAGECELHGKFDVWVMQDDRLIVSDLGFPSDEPKQSLALGINNKLATQIAQEKSRQLGTSVLTTQRGCFGCSTRFWMSEHEALSGAAETGKGYLCPACIGLETEGSMAKKLGILGYWCG